MDPGSKTLLEQTQQTQWIEDKKTAQDKSGRQPSNPHHPAICTTLRCDDKIIGTTHVNSACVSINSRLRLHHVKI